MTLDEALAANTAPKGNLLSKQLIFVSFFAALTLVSLTLPMSEVSIPMMHFLPMHTVMEFVAIAVAFLVFATVWHTPTKLTSGSLLMLGMSLFAAGWLDVFHTLSYKGMPDFVTPASVEKAIGFWLAARFIVAAGLLATSFRPMQSPVSVPVRYGALAVFTLVNLLVTWLIVFHEAELPHTFIDGIGVTALKTQLEWLIVGMMALAAWRYYRQARANADEFSPLIFSATVIGALGETFFTQYHQISDLQHFLGHLYKMISYGLIYQAMFIESVRRPYQQLAQKTQALLKANESLRVHSLALESTASPVLVTNLYGHVRWRNRAAMKMSPVLFAEQANKLHLFAAPLTPDATQAQEIKTSVSSGQIWRGLVHLVGIDGKNIIFDRTVTPLCDEKAAIEGYVVVGDNVTERLTAQQRNKRVLDNALDGFWVVNTEGYLLEVNKAYTRMSGYTVEELLNMRIDQLEAVERSHEVREHLQQVCQLGSTQFETRHRHKSGDLFSVDISATYDPECHQIFTFIRDRTERVQAAVVKKDLERQLQQAQKMEALGQLTGGIAHDFNNILAAVLGYSNLALERFAPDKQSKLAKYLREIISASERARDLIAKMLTFASMQPSMKTVEISPEMVISDVVSMLRHSIPSNIKLNLGIHDHLKIRMDAGELNQMLVNLIINARDAISEHGVIDVQLHQVEIDGEICLASQQRLFGSYLALDVSDSGSGIAPEHLPRLFDPFFTTKEVGKGTGLGLSMVQGILRRSHGHIVVTSEPDKGSRFRLLFPIALSSEPSAEIHTNKLATQTGGGQHIWVVDDDSMVATCLGELLEHAGYTVRLFTNSFEVLETIEDVRNTVDLLITDQTMPGLSGTALTQRLLALRPDLPIIMCSGYGQGIACREAQDAGIRRCFNKPVPAETLLNAVAEELALSVGSPQT